MKKDKEGEALLLKLALLDKVMKLHTWTPVGQQEAEDLERAEVEAKSEARGSITDQPEEE